jgi:phosphatidylserine/phosphatidylglycerophosphate/cardiolipin synthase-like enzyme
MEVSKADSSGIDVVINEIMYDPMGSDSGSEWIEFYNNGTNAVNITNWIITDQDGGDDFIFPEMTFPPNAYMVINTGEGTNDTDFSDGTANLFFGINISFLTNTGDDVLLKNETGYGIDYVAYHSGTSVDPPPPELNWSGPSPSAFEGHSISLHPNGIDKDSGLSWEESDPTPGKTNAHLDDDPPDILEIRHSPINPTSAEEVTITANVTEDWAIKSVGLFYSINGTTHFSTPMGYDGTNYTAQIPAQVGGTVIEYHVNATDDAEQTSMSSQYSYAYSDLPIQVVINEFLADPASDWDEDGWADYKDEWIELYNLGITIVNLGFWKIDDSMGFGSIPYTIPFGTLIMPNSALVFYRNITDIALDNNGDNVTVLNAFGSIVDSHIYHSSKDDTAIGRFPDGSENWRDFLLPTPGCENQYTVDSLGNLSNIKINEFMPSPKITYSTEWIELYNSGTTPVRLDGCWLDDVMNGGKKPWQIPLNTTIQPDGVLFFNMSFGLNNDGDTVNLLYVDGTTIMDSYSYDSSEYDISFGRRTDGDENWVSFSYPTPDQSNFYYREPNSSERSIVISELFYKASYKYEFFSLHNPSNAEINITGWRVCDGKYSYSGTLIFPENSLIHPMEHLYIANSASLFFEIMGFYPQFEYGNSMVTIPEMITREEPSFTNDRDEAMLLDSFGNIIDIAVYGDSEYEGLGWNGSPILDAGKGEILKRNFDERDLIYADTNSSLDWRHIRHYKLGQSNFEYDSFTYAGNITLFASPDSSFSTIIKEIEGAKNTIYMSLYQLTNWNITEKILEKLNDGVEVKVLMEGGPVEGLLEEQKYILQKIVENKGEVRFLVTNSALSSRYRYVHAKYAVIDNISVIISSENWKYTGVPINNTFGNRGWGVVLRDESIAEYFLDVFLVDWSYVSYDIISFTPDDPNYGNASPDFELDDWVETGYYTPVFPGETLEGEYRVSPVLSPETTLLESEAIIGMINSAVDSIYIEQLDIALNWNYEDLEYENLFLKAAIEAAEKRQVEVRILLSSYYAFPDDPELDNYDTFVYINDYAFNHNITDYLKARLIDYDRLGLSKLHNKGMIVDSNKTLISSINWNRNSVTQNREVGVIIESQEVAEYFTEIFLWDWNEPPIASAGRDITVNVNDAIQFSDLSLDTDHNIVGYFWDFDDGTNSTEQNPVHTFKKEGIYEVRLAVNDGQYTDSDTITVIVLEAETEGGELAVTLSMILFIILVVIIVVIIAFIRRMRQVFL